MAATMLGALSVGARKAFAQKRGNLPKGFLWGAATAGHQVEGNNTGSDIWLLERVKPTIFSEPSGSAADSYNRYVEDINIVAELGLNCYRFSAEWARIETEKGQFSQSALDHYSRMVDQCLAKGLAPVLTYSHFSTPRWFAALGGFEEKDSAEMFARYADRLTRTVGDRLALAITFNEPNIARQLAAMPAFGELRKAAGQMFASAAREAGSNHFSSSLFVDPDRTESNMLAAHRAGYQAIKAGPGSFLVGPSLAIADEQGVGDVNQAEEKRRTLYGAWLEAARGSDFVGVQTYTRNLVGPDGDLPIPENAERTQMESEFYPSAVGGTIRYAAAITGKPVYVTENGVATEDDTRRVAYIDGALREVRRCIDDGIDVRGYIHWSLLDNFEWVLGYRPKFGLVSVDRGTFRRTPKPSALHLGRYARSNRI
ncbi:family 1 glycosylhydrolase [Sphingomonas sp. GM_Shp_2]|uniref:glycoside hydrolase family 1 protein n=1 Tax=Sphingomonas sp. GM_Shp_2 TaxID=2937380 RepID=UPI00226AD574|nr:family 1 glycosylhydrolase [Sphingomonas sp. GM_Shp_2]